MTESVINPDLLKKLKDLDAYFFDVLQRAEKNASANGKSELSNDEVRSVLATDVSLYLRAPGASNKITDLSENLSNEEKARKLIELSKGLNPVLAAVAGLGGPRPELESQLQQQMGLSNSGLRSGQQENLMTHPKLEPFLDQAASSFLDAYKKIYDEHNKAESKDPTKDQSKDLDNALRNVMKFMPVFNQVKPKQELKPEAPKPQYVPTMKPTARPF
jgi:hypothetical protein